MAPELIQKSRKETWGANVERRPRENVRHPPPHPPPALHDPARRLDARRAELEVSLYDYDAGTEVLETDRNGNVRAVAPNDAGYLTQSNFPVSTGVEQDVSIDVSPTTGLIMGTTDALGREHAYTYDAYGNQTSDTYPYGWSDAVTTSKTYTPDYNEIASFTDALSHVTTYGYDPNGNETSVTDPLGHSTTMTYDWEGRLLTTADALGNTWTRTYQGADLATLTDPLGNVVTYTHDQVGRLISQSDPVGAKTAYVNDDADQLTEQIDALGNNVQYGYDDGGNLLFVQDQNGHQTTYTYDSMNRQATKTDPLSHTESYSYATNGLPSEIVDRKGQTTDKTYDARNRLSEVIFHHADGGIESTIAYTYDGADRLTEVVDSLAGTIDRTYDDFDQLLSETTPMGAVTYTYDAAGRRTSLSITGQTTVDYAYDDANRLTSITRGGDTIELNYDNASRRTSMSMPDGTGVIYGYDADSRLTSVTYTKNGDGGPAIGTLTYAYDAAGHLVSKGGTLASTLLPAAVASATYNADNQLTLWGSQGFLYDLNGNMTADGTNAYSWNVRNQLVALTPDGGTANTFGYDAFGRRQKKVINGTETDFLFDQNGNLAAELTDGGEYFTSTDLEGFSPDELVCRYTAGADGGLNQPLMAMTDINGSVVGLVGDGGVIQATYAYEPYGATQASGTDEGNSQQFTARENDGTELLYFRWRHYNPKYGRFISEDPSGFAGGPNLYEYADGDPVDQYDPSGLSGFRPISAEQCQAMQDELMDLIDQRNQNLAACGPKNHKKKAEQIQNRIDNLQKRINKCLENNQFRYSWLFMFGLD